MGVQLSTGTPVFSSFGYLPRSRTAGSYGSSIFNFLEELPYHFPQQLHSQCTGFQFLHSLATTSYLLFFFIIAILMGMKWYLIVVLICIPLMISDV